MPFGVEHMKHQAASLNVSCVPDPVMPFGVEHQLNFGDNGNAMYWVPDPVMPFGVEHATRQPQARSA